MITKPNPETPSVKLVEQKKYRLISMEELAEIMDLSEDLVIVEDMSKKIEIARKRIDIVNRVRSRQSTVVDDDEDIILHLLDDIVTHLESNREELSKELGFDAVGVFDKVLGYLRGESPPDIKKTIKEVL